MPIPSLDKHGLLPHGIHDCTLAEIGQTFGRNSHRQQLFQHFTNCLKIEIRPSFDNLIYVDGSFVTDKDQPDDIDIVLDLRNTSDGRKWQGLMFMSTHQNRLLREYRIHFWVNFPGRNDFSAFFQYIGVKTARFKGLNPNHLKGILRIDA